MNKRITRKIAVLDSHTGGEPTRLVLEGGPDLGGGTLAQRLAVFREKHDRWRAAIVNEPRGSDAIVGALLCAPSDPSCDVGVIFFNNVGYIGMCGHGTIGLVASLEYLGRIRPGVVRIETPVGIVGAELLESGEVVVANVASHRAHKDVAVEVPGIGRVRGDVAWGGNWFFLVQDHGMEIRLSNLESLTGYATRLRQALTEGGVRGDNAALVDHIELFAPADAVLADARNFVLCPGNAYDRSPCGTGTSAKLACLFADGKLREGQEWRQQGIVGSIFRAHVKVREGRVFPFIRGSAHVTAETSLIVDEGDPFAWGIA
ncbi:MAG TPA: proline racemase family protein [Casimicrobiaceae bacterium]|nr:proline racemase family protein [Casimicrobiaceae bacterium]